MTKDSVVIIDYGSGNLRSVAKAFEHVSRDQGRDFKVTISSRAEDIAKASRIILPGQGAFSDCMEGLQSIDGMMEALSESVIKRAQPFMGICVGMQLMAARSLEHGVTAGLDWISGEVVPMNPQNKNLKIPHMGWNNLVISSIGEQDNNHFVLRSVSNLKDYYFVHSFMFKCDYDHHILAMTDYDGFIPAAIGKDNVIGLQFHPEKSQKAGLQLISDFLLWKP